jgi:hypothetical protein
MSTDIQTLPAMPGITLRVVVIILALLHTIAELFGLSAFANLSEYAGNGWAQWLLLAGLAVFPFLAVAALIFAFRGDVRRAIMLIALIAIVTFVTDQLPSIFTHGMDLKGSNALLTLYFYVKTFVLPLLAVVAFVLARRNEKLALAAAFASLTMVSAIVDVVGFAIGIAIYGF